MKKFRIFPICVLLIANSVLYAQFDESAGSSKSSDLIPFEPRSTDYTFDGSDGEGSTEGPSTTTCTPGYSYWCSTGFQEECLKLKGGLGSSEDGGVFCTLNEYEEPVTIDSFSDHTKIQEEIITLHCEGDCAWLVKACTEREGVGSSVDDGVSCEVDNSNCSGCD